MLDIITRADLDGAALINVAHVIEGYKIDRYGITPGAVDLIVRKATNYAAVFSKWVNFAQQTKVEGVKGMRLMGTIHVHAKVYIYVYGRKTS